LTDTSFLPITRGVLNKALCKSHYRLQHPKGRMRTCNELGTWPDLRSHPDIFLEAINKKCWLQDRDMRGTFDLLTAINIYFSHSKGLLKPQAH
jgi:hypothetical protein